MIIKQVEQKEKRKGASRCPSRDGRDEEERPGPGKREVFCPSLKGKGDRPNGRWMGSYTDRLRNTIFKIQRGVRTLYPLKRALSPFSTGLGDSSSSSPSRGTQSFVLP